MTFRSHSSHINIYLCPSASSIQEFNKLSFYLVNIQMLKLNKIKYSKLKNFWAKWQILMWKAVLMRLSSPISTVLEIIIAIIFSLQIRLMFEPHALHVQVIQLLNMKWYNYKIVMKFGVIFSIELNNSPLRNSIMLLIFLQEVFI